MSNAIFPTVTGLGWSVHKIPLWKTLLQEAASGKETRVALSTQPRWQIQLTYEFLKNDGVINGGNPDDDLRTIQGFFLQRQGKFDNFIWQDPYDNSQGSTPVNIGTGDGTTTSFRVARSIGGFSELISYLNSTPRIFINDWQGNTECFSTARTNLALQSQAQDNASWSKSGVTASPDTTTAPDGTVTADSLIETAVTSIHGSTQAAAINGSPTTVSVYAKQRAIGDRNWLCIQLGSNLAFFDVQNGVLGTVAGGLTATITSLGAVGGGGWYRCTVSGTPGSTTFGIFLASANGTSSYLGDITKGMYIWGAQSEAGSSATRYIATTAATVTTTDFTVGTTNGYVTFAVAPRSAAAITAFSFTFSYRVRFLEDQLDFENFLWKLFTLKQCDLITDLT